MFIDIDDMFFAYCIILKRSAQEFWDSRPSQIVYCIEKYYEMIDQNQPSNSNNTTTITSMREIAGWGDMA